MKDEEANARATNAEPWEPPPGMLKRQWPECWYFFAAPEPGCSAPIAHLRAPGRCCTTTDGVPEKGSGRVRLIRSAFWPLCFNDFSMTGTR
jgi:hypothetical protein